VAVRRQFVVGPLANSKASSSFPTLSVVDGILCGGMSSSQLLLSIVTIVTSCSGRRALIDRPVESRPRKPPAKRQIPTVSFSASRERPQAVSGNVGQRRHVVGIQNVVGRKQQKQRYTAITATTSGSPSTTGTYRPSSDLNFFETNGSRTCRLIHIGTPHFAADQDYTMVESTMVSRERDLSRRPLWPWPPSQLPPW
jgi:hypothetical protein